MEKNMKRMRSEVGKICAAEFFQPPDKSIRRSGAV
jgi:hypothetical protein